MKKKGPVCFDPLCQDHNAALAGSRSAVDFPKPGQVHEISPRLRYRMEYGRRLLDEIRRTEIVQAHETESSWTKAGDDWRVAMLRYVFDSIDELGPVGNHERNLMRRGFVDSVEKSIRYMKTGVEVYRGAPSRV